MDLYKSFEVLANSTPILKMEKAYPDIVKMVKSVENKKSKKQIEKEKQLTRLEKLKSLS
jgi:hypothetical protein